MTEIWVNLKKERRRWKATGKQRNVGEGEIVEVDEQERKIVDRSAADITIVMPFSFFISSSAA